MLIAVRKEKNETIYFDKEIYNRTQTITNENGEIEIVRVFTDKELSLPPYNYTKVYVPDEYAQEIDALDFDDDLTFNVDKYNKRKQEKSKEELRFKRVPLLKAFDVYKSNVNYGIVFESEEERQEIIEWYKSLLELEESSFETIPERIKYYL